jgi:hypothetical protein
MRVGVSRGEAPVEDGADAPALTSRDVLAPGPASIDQALAAALAGATAAGHWDVVAQLAREFEARRLAGPNVVALPAKRNTKW